MPSFISDPKSSKIDVVFDSLVLQKIKIRKAKEKQMRKNVGLIGDYLDELDWQVKENSNMGYSLQGMRNYISNEVTKDYWLKNVYSAPIALAHKEGDLHIHDLGELNAYCCGWDLQDLLREGFTGAPGKVSSAPAKHLSSLLGQMVNFIYTLQGESAGAQAFSNFDTLLAPFVAKDKLNYKELKQEIQSFVYNVNVPTRVGFQTPFFNITMDMNVPSYLKDEHVVIGGAPSSEKYSDFQKEMDMINKAFAEVMMEGDSTGKVFTFPIPTYNVTKDFDWQDSRFEKIWEMTAKYGIPYFANYINSDMNPEDARSMCCRLRLDNRELRKRGGGLFAANPLTGSIGVVTINLPRLGYLSQNKEEFFTKLDELMDIARDSLEVKRGLIEDLTEKGLYPYSKHYLAGTKMRTGAYWGNHFSTIGLIGMNEALDNLLGVDITNKDGKHFAENVLEHMRERIMQYQDETGNLYNLEATPGEGTSYRLARSDQQKFGNNIIYANSEIVHKGGDPYYTNSTHLPVGYTDDVFEALDLQDSLQTKYTGGTVLHGFLGERVNSTETTKNLVQKISKNYHLPYFTLTPTFSVCPEHGYISGEHPECPKCHKESLVYSRIVGYLSPVSNWNKGKKAEWVDRKEYVVK